MRTRTEAARYAEDLLADKIKLIPQKQAWHFGKVDLRMLFDFIWEGEPKVIEDLLDSRQLRNKTGEKNKRFDND